MTEPNGTLDVTKLELSIDAEGRWRHQGEEITHERLLAMLYRSLKKAGEGYVVCAGPLCVPIQVADCPFVVLAVRHGPDGVQLLLSNGDRVRLQPQTLTLDAANVPRCVVYDDGTTARFSRSAWMQLAEAVRETEHGEFRLRVGTEEVPITVVT
jgi:hypothetical protein